MSEREIHLDDVGPSLIGRVVRLEHSIGVTECGIVEYYKRNNMGFHLLLRGGQSTSFLPPPPKRTFKAQEEPDHPRIFLLEA
jgi:hypothetical protein